MSIVFALALSLAPLAPMQAPSTTPTAAPAKKTVKRADKIEALRHLVAIWPAYADPKDPLAQLVGMGVYGIVLDLAELDPKAPPAEQQQKLEPVMKELAAAGVDVGPALAPVLVGFQRFGCRSKQSEAKGNLKALYVMQESHRAEFDSYTTMDRLEWQPRGSRYRYEVLSATDKRFKARAVGLDDMAGDEWTITQDNDLVNTKSPCPAE